MMCYHLLTETSVTLFGITLHDTFATTDHVLCSVNSHFIAEMLKLFLPKKTRLVDRLMWCRWYDVSIFDFVLIDYVLCLQNWQLGWCCFKDVQVCLFLCIFWACVPVYIFCILKSCMYLRWLIMCFVYPTDGWERSCLSRCCPPAAQHLA